MKMKIRVPKYGLAMVFRHGDLVRVLEPGAYWLMERFLPWNGLRIERVDTLDTRFEHEKLDALVREPALAEKLEVVDLSDEQRAIVWRDGRLYSIFGPGRYALWRGPGDVKIEVYDVNALRFDHPRLDAVVNFPSGARYFECVQVEQYERVLLYRDGELMDQLGAGRYVFWKGAGRLAWRTVDLREQVADVSGQEIMTGDKVSVRVNLVVSYQVVDAVASVSEVSDSAQALYREAQLALREAIGGRQLDQLLADKDQFGAEIRNALAPRADEFGVAVRGVGLRDVILPGDMKQILNEVILAQKQAEASLIRRREETAAVRSQANTAKLLDQNPVLVRMKEIEALQEILKGTRSTFVFGSTDIVDQVRGLTGAASESMNRDEESPS